MGDSTKIQWTESTWNPVRGCTVVSPGCENCYAMGVAARFSGEGQPYEGLAKFSSARRLPQWTGKVRLVPEHLADPLRWTRPRRVFVNSMSDLFHEGLTNEDIAAVFGVMAASPRHTFQVLTKRARRMREWFEWLHAKRCRSNPDSHLFVIADAALRAGCDVPITTEWQRRSRHDEWPLPNVWLGVSAEDQQRANERIPYLLDTPAAVRFVSYEPALGPIDFSTISAPGWESPSGRSWVDAMRGYINGSPFRTSTTLDWVIVGGESGPRARPFDIAWARSVVEQCKAAGVACFVKQLGRRVMGDARDLGDLVVSRIVLRDGGEYVPPVIGYSAWLERHADKIAGVICAGKADRPDDWPADLRVRQFPEAHP